MLTEAYVNNNMCLIWFEISSSSNIADFFNGRSITGGMNGKGKYILELSQYEKEVKRQIFSPKMFAPQEQQLYTTEKKRSCSVLREPCWKTTKLTTLKLHSGRGLLTTQTAFRNVVVWVRVSFSLFRASQKNTSFSKRSNTVEFWKTASKFRERKRKSLSCVYVLNKKWS